jgi:coenzyme F420-reducing hydrogenase gamma subunit
LAVFKFASCDGCQLSLLNCEDQLLAISKHIQIAYFPEASRAMLKGPYDISLIEGSITTPHDVQRIAQVRKSSKCLVTMGACATSGGIQALRNFKNVKDFISIVYARPQYIETLESSTPIADHVKVDFELRGCPVSKIQLLELLTSLLYKKKPNLPTESVCVECKQASVACLTVSQSRLCMGPLTQRGCGALCPKFNRPCYGCFGPVESPNLQSMERKWSELGLGKEEVIRAIRSFNAAAPAFRKDAADTHG